MYKPALRPLDFRPVTHQGQQMWYLRDPLELTDYQIMVPPALTQILVLCDGTRTPQQIHQAFSHRLGMEVEYEIVEHTLAQLDAACLLDNDHAYQKHQHLLESYRNQPHRPPALADLSYPGHPARLTNLLKGYSYGDYLNGWQPWRGRGIISPHIDYQRGGPVYSQVWRRAETAVLEADLVLIFGTDHNGGAGTFTLTRQPYATPFGVLPSDTDLIDKLAIAIGPAAAFGEELHHRKEHSVELSAVWLHHVYEQAGVKPAPMVPILCGSFHHFVASHTHPANDKRLMTAIETLQRETAGRKVLAVASVDLAHVGPAFDGKFPINEDRQTHLRESDQQLMQAIGKGDAADFYAQIAAVRDRNNICGFSSIYLMLRYLGEVKGQEIAYRHCPADPQNTSFVSICGMLLE